MKKNNMVILGLGSNLGDRLTHLREGLKRIRQIPTLTIEQISPVYISDALLPDNAPTQWDTPYLNLALRCETTLNPYELLHYTKNIEKMLGREEGADWGPRVIDIDLLAWDQLIQYDDKLHIPHEHLHIRPFALWPLADVAPHWQYPIPGPMHGKTAVELASQWGSRFSAEAPLHTQQISQRIDTPALMGIINITPDSFSDGGNCLESSAAFNQAVQLIENGAELIDVGAEATGPSAKPLDSQTEWQRLESILQKLCAERAHFVIPPKISVDTRHADVAEKALALGVDCINDVSGLENDAMLTLLAHSQCDIVFMHHLGIPVDKTHTLALNEDPVAIVYQWAEHRINAFIEKGIRKQRLIFDVGIGYGKTSEQSLELVKNIAIFRQLGVRLLIGHSRKSFLTQFTLKPALERDLQTVIVSLNVAKQVDYLRVHNVSIHSEAFRVQRVFT